MRIILALLAGVLLSGCCHNVGLIQESALCQPPQELLSTCDLPVKIEEDITYADLLKLVQEDRAHLRTCGRHYEDLLKFINDCNQKIDKHNQEIRKINAIIK